MSELHTKSHKKTVFIILTIMVLVFAYVTYFGLIKPRQKAQQLASNVKINGVLLPTAQEISRFQLDATTGGHFNNESFKGHWTLMFFGFTNCGMVCPTSLSAMNGMYKTLQQQLPDNKLPQIVFITVDPERDTLQRIKDYLGSFNSHFMGARADINDIVKIEQQFHIAAAKIQVDGQGKDHYTINHSAEILVVNPDGQLQAYLSYPHTAEQLVQDYKALLMLKS